MKNKLYIITILLTVALCLVPASASTVGDGSAWEDLSNPSEWVSAALSKFDNFVDWVFGIKEAPPSADVSPSVDVPGVSSQASSGLASRVFLPKSYNIWNGSSNAYAGSDMWLYPGTVNDDSGLSPSGLSGAVGYSIPRGVYGYSSGASWSDVMDRYPTLYYYTFSTDSLSSDFAIDLGIYASLYGANTVGVYLYRDPVWYGDERDVLAPSTATGLYSSWEWSLSTSSSYNRKKYELVLPEGNWGLVLSFEDLNGYANGNPPPVMTGTIYLYDKTIPALGGLSPSEDKGQNYSPYAGYTLYDPTTGTALNGSLWDVGTSAVFSPSSGGWVKYANYNNSGNLYTFDLADGGQVTFNFLEPYTQYSEVSPSGATTGGVYQYYIQGDYYENYNTAAKEEEQGGLLSVGESIAALVSGIIGAISAVVTGIVEGLTTLLNDITGLISGVLTFPVAVGSVFTSIFGFLPPEISGVLVGGFGLLVAISVFRLFR